MTRGYDEDDMRMMGLLYESYVHLRDEIPFPADATGDRWWFEAGFKSAILHLEATRLKPARTPVR